MSEKLLINEIYLSIQGESTFAGLPCVFVRLARCNLRCSYCDTAYAFTGGIEQSLDEVAAAVEKLAQPFRDQASLIGKLPLVEFTGGEPLLQRALLPLMTMLADGGYTLLLETSGALDISSVDPRVHRIMDLKTPSSGEVERNRWQNIAFLKASDEVKFVIGTWEDLDWAKTQLATHKLATICPILFSWVNPLAPHQQDSSLKPVPPGLRPISRRELVEAITSQALPVRFQLQMHKFIWPPDERGV